MRAKENGWKDLTFGIEIDPESLSMWIFVRPKRGKWLAMSAYIHNYGWVYKSNTCIERPCQIVREFKATSMKDARNFAIILYYSLMHIH